MSCPGLNIFLASFYFHTFLICTDMYRSCFAFAVSVVELEPSTATLSSTHNDGQAGKWVAGKCIDGNTDPGPWNNKSVCMTKSGDATPWIAIDYGARVTVERVGVFNRELNGDRTRNVDVRISDELPTSGDHMFSGGTLLGHFAGPGRTRQHIIISGQKLL